MSQKETGTHMLTRCSERKPPSGCRVDGDVCVQSHVESLVHRKRHRDDELPWVLDDDSKANLHLQQVFSGKVVLFVAEWVATGTLYISSSDDRTQANGFMRRQDDPNFRLPSDMHVDGQEVTVFLVHWKD